MPHTRKVYISGLAGCGYNQPETFAAAEQDILRSGLAAVNPAKVNAQLPEGMCREEYMGLSACLLDMCDAIYMLHGWEQSPWAKWELGYAMAKGKDVLKEEGSRKETSACLARDRVEGC